jgi:hypothetical protein
MDTKSRVEVMDALEDCLNEAADLTELLRPEDFRNSDDYRNLVRGVNVAGGIVCAEHRRLRDIRRED